MELRNPKIIALWGKGERGKTHTLNLVAALLKLNRGATIKQGQVPEDLSKDCNYIVEYRNKKIGIVTCGDDSKTLSSAFDNVDNDCDIYLCATRTRGSSVEFVRNKFYNILWVERWSITTENFQFDEINTLQQKVNEIQAVGIIDIIDGLI